MKKENLETLFDKAKGAYLEKTFKGYQWRDTDYPHIVSAIAGAFDKCLQIAEDYLASAKPSSLDDRRAEFKRNVFLFSKDYPVEMLTAFVDYWTEATPSGRKMRFELEKTWETSRRLARWAHNNDRYNNNYGRNERTTEERRDAGRLQRARELGQALYYNSGEK